MSPKLTRSVYQQFLESFFTNPVENIETLGRRFLATHFPGMEDPDVSEESDHHRCVNLIEERYVQP